MWTPSTGKGIARFTCIPGRSCCRPLPSTAYTTSTATHLEQRVFAYLEIEGDDVLQVLGEVAKTEIKKKWDAEVTVQVLPTAADDCDQQFLEIERIFYAP